MVAETSRETSYQSEFLAQVPKGNLPVIFSGTCECKGGCALHVEAIISPLTDVPSDTLYSDHEYELDNLLMDSKQAVQKLSMGLKVQF